MNALENWAVNRRRFLTASSAAAGFVLIGGVAIGKEETLALPGKKLIVHSTDPPNAEPALDDLLSAGWITPVESFYVRSHAPAPDLDAKSFRLSVGGLVDKELSLPLGELQERFELVEVTATLTCAGNRRNEHSLTKQVDGVPWGAGAIGNAKWKGVRLADVLRAAGVSEKGGRHVWFEGLDRIEREDGTIPFGCSLTMRHALAKQGPILAFEMNDAPLTALHGFPLRAVVPGYIGARSVKWLGKVIVGKEPSTNHYMRKGYTLLHDQEGGETVRRPLTRFPINSAICRPAADAKIAGKTTPVAGYALASGAPALVERVEVSADGGLTWQRAELDSHARALCWRHWKADVAVTADTRELIVRALDNRGAVQPQRVEWNEKGYVYNAWHKVPIKSNR